MLSAGWREGMAGAVALAAAVMTRKLPAAMVFGIAAIWALRHEV